MHSRVATWLLAIAAGAVGVSLLVCRNQDRRPTAAPVARAMGCGGWTAFALPAGQLVDVAARARDDLWLLTTRGVYHFDGCTWRAHGPFADLSGTIIEWETIVVDSDHAIVVSGESPAGPRVTHGCTKNAACCHVEPSFPARRRSYRFDGRAWRPIAPRPRATPEVDVEPMVLGAERDPIATATVDPDEMLAIAKRVHQIAASDADGHIYGWSGVTSYELWRRDRGAWSIVLEPVNDDNLPPEVVAALTPVERRQREHNAEIHGPTVLDVHGQSAKASLRSSKSWASSPSDVYMVAGKLRHFDSRQWSDVALDEPVVNAVWGTARDDVWVGGSSGVWHFDGSSWRRARGDAWIYGIGGSGPRDVWAVGHRQETAMPEVLHFDGKAWRSHYGHLPLNRQYHLTGVTSTGRDAWVVGEWGTVLYWNGAWWIEQAKPTFGALDAVSVENGVLWVAGDGVYRFD